MPERTMPYYASEHGVPGDCGRNPKPAAPVEQGEELALEALVDDGFLYALLLRHKRMRERWWTPYIPDARLPQAVSEAERLAREGYEVRVIRVPAQAPKA